MTTTVNNTVANNTTVFTVNNDMLNEKKALKYVKKEIMHESLYRIQEELVKLGVMEKIELDYTKSTPKDKFIAAYKKFVDMYNEATQPKQQDLFQEETTVEEPVVTVVEEEPVVAPVEEEKSVKKEKKAKKEDKETKEYKERKCKTGTASERVEKYSKELEEKEAIVADEEKLNKLTSEERKALRHRIASLKRKIKRANYQLTIHGIKKQDEPVEEENVVVPDNVTEDIDSPEK